MGTDPNFRPTHRKGSIRPEIRAEIGVVPIFFPTYRAGIILASERRPFFTDAVRYGSLFRKVVDQYGWPGIALAAVGAGALAFRKGTRWPLALLGLTYAGHVFFIMAYNTRDPDWSDFFIPLHLMAAVLMGVGV